MSGHNRWSKIQHKKGAADAKKSALFTKIIREITVAARNGGGDPDGNARLRMAIGNARANQMSNENIDRAIKRGTGELEGVDYQEIRFEGYGPAGVALIIDCMTDNKNRTTSEVRHMLSKHGGNLGTTGCVVHQFSRKGVIEIEQESAIDEDKLLEFALELDGFEDAQVDGETATLHVDPAKVNDIGEAVRAAGYNVTKAETAMVPSVTTQVSGRQAESVLKLYELIEEHDDVQKVYANFEIDDAELERIMGG